MKTNIQQSTTTPTDQHTTGPWTNGDEFSYQQDEVVAANGAAIALVWVRRGPSGANSRPQFKDDHEGLANARLIAAAPELLSALELCMDFMNRAHGGEGMTEDERWQLIADARFEAQSAITKARGQS